MEHIQLSSENKRQWNDEFENIKEIQDPKGISEEEEGEKVILDRMKKSDESTKSVEST